MSGSNGAGPSIPTEQLLIGVFSGPQGVRLQTPMPPGQALRILLALCEDLRERIVADMVGKEQPRLQVVPPMPGLTR